MAYESPISVWWSDTKIEQLRDEYNNIIVKAAKKCYPQVDKDELIKALNYDREQYEKGYRDGRLYQQPVCTNADCIRAMTDEELAKLFDSWIQDCDCNDIPCRKSCEENSGSGCINHWLDWLKEEAKDER